MNKRDFVALWIIVLIVMFGTFYILTGVLVNRVMADFVEPITPQERATMQLEVKPNYGNQTDDHYKVQETVNPQKLN